MRVWLNQVNFSFMSVKIRLQRRGRRKKPFYHIVVADARAPRDGRFIEKLGTYNPMTSPATIELDRDRTFDWLMKGAQPTDTARAILKFQGLFYRLHLQRGVTKGALTQEKADEMYVAYVADKDSKIRARHEATAEARTEWYKTLSGTAKPIVVKVEESEAVANEEVSVTTGDEAEDAQVAEEATSADEAPEADAAEAEVVDEVTEESTKEEAPVEETTEEESPAEETTEATEETPVAESGVAEEAPAEEETKTPAEDSTEAAPVTEEESPAEEGATEEAPAEEEKAEEASTEEDTTEEKKD